LTEQAAADHDYELDEDWLEEQLLDSPDAEVQTSESPAEAPASPGTSHFFCCLLATCFAVYLPLLFCLAAEPNVPAGDETIGLADPETVDVPVSTQSRRSRVTRRQVESLLYLFLL
jgi:hypothetical protein